MNAKPVAWICDVAAYGDHLPDRFLTFENPHHAAIPADKITYTPLYVAAAVEDLRNEVARLNGRLAVETRLCNEANTNTAAIFGVLVDISLQTRLGGEVAEYRDVLEAVEDVVDAAKDVIAEWEDGLGESDSFPVDHPMIRLQKALGQRE